MEVNGNHMALAICSGCGIGDCLDADQLLKEA